MPGEPLRVADDSIGEYEIREPLEHNDYDIHPVGASSTVVVVEDGWILCAYTGGLMLKELLYIFRPLAEVDEQLTVVEGACLD